MSAGARLLSTETEGLVSVEEMCNWTVAMETYDDVVEKYENLFYLADRVVDVHQYLVDHVGTESLVAVAAGQDHV